MERLIYYPSFETYDNCWLKFALLYLDSLHPIIPEQGMCFLGEDFRRIIAETDLVRPYSPDLTQLRQPLL